MLEETDRYYSSEIYVDHSKGWRRIKDRGLALVKEFEGLKLTAYRCPAGVWTIGYGHTSGVTPDMEITEAQAERMLREDLFFSERSVSTYTCVPLNDNQFGALASFTFNVGIESFKKSTLLKLLNRGWYDQVPAQLMRWTKVGGMEMGGLSRRRTAEARLWDERGS